MDMENDSLLSQNHAHTLRQKSMFSVLYLTMS